MADLSPVVEGVRRLLRTPIPPSLGPGPRTGTRSLESLEQELRAALPDAGIPPRQRNLIRALVLLWHDHLDAAHAIAQGIEDADGSYVHAIMHRREPDAWNSKYWFRRVGRHAAFGPLAGAVDRLLVTRGDTGLSSRLLPGGRWDPGAFVDFTGQCRGLSPADPGGAIAVAIQEIEFGTLLDHCCAGLAG